MALSRFEHHIEVPEIGLEGQKKLLSSSALVVGVGGLGCPAALYLASAGVGTIGLIDQDVVGLSNLQRQILYDESSVGMKKVEAAAKRLHATASFCTVVTHPFFLDETNAQDIIPRYDMILDCTDNLDARYLINRVCHAGKKTFVSASLHHHDGQVSVFKSFCGDAHPCYECVYPRVDRARGFIPSCTQGGVVGPAAGIFGCLQASLALNELLGIGETLSGHMLMFSALNFESLKVQLKKNKNCAACSVV